MTVVPIKPTQEILEPLFPKTYRAIEKAEKNKSKAQWEIGDALLEECPGNPDTYQDGSYKKIEEFNQFLLSRGYENYSIDTLRQLRTVSKTFPISIRILIISWSVHSVLRTRPNLLKELHEKFGQITVQMARGYLIARIKDERESEEKIQRALADKAQQDLIAAHKHEEQLRQSFLRTNSEDERKNLEIEHREAQEEIKKAEIFHNQVKLPPPQGEVKPQIPPPTNKMIGDISILTFANAALRQAIEIHKALSQHNPSPETIEELYEIGMKIQQSWIEFNNRIRKENNPPRPIYLVTGNN
jgi:hypothetical protein